LYNFLLKKTCWCFILYSSSLKR